VDGGERGDEDGDREQPADGVAHQNRSAWSRTWTRYTSTATPTTRRRMEVNMTPS
jgi:hypothetical protein